jgi:hypothetical protein
MKPDVVDQPDHDSRPGDGVWSAVALILAGDLSVSGSFMTWDTCPDSSCHRDELALMALWETSGVEFGPGIATVLLGILLVVLGLWALRAPARARPFGLLAGVGVMLTTLGFFLRMHVFTDERYYGPDLGLIVVALGGLIAILASRRLPRSRAVPPAT